MQYTPKHQPMRPIMRDFSRKLSYQSVFYFLKC